MPVTLSRGVTCAISIGAPDEANAMLGAPAPCRPLLIAVALLTVGSLQYSIKTANLPNLRAIEFAGEAGFVGAQASKQAKEEHTLQAVQSN